jgi:hypothetical protein
MLRFYTSRELSRRFNINLAKLKRWSREFLPPDPLGGLQSGFARQYNPDEAFTLYLGGHLMSALKFTIPEARQILSDLHRWLMDNRYYYNFSQSLASKKNEHQTATRYQILIMRNHNPQLMTSGLYYVIRGSIFKRQLDDGPMGILIEERYTESVMDPHKCFVADADNGSGSCRIIFIDDLRQRFLFQLSTVSD